MPGLQCAPSGAQEAEVVRAAGARARARAASPSALETTEPGGGGGGGRRKCPSRLVNPGASELRGDRAPAGLCILQRWVLGLAAPCSEHPEGKGSFNLP